ncbi:MAG: 5-formyltetrahydrofolate cyclo-ligase [Candidatus Omnitrophica bacterium]|nr:5-formyltetrahydrofolate cyclo-ligase [Candidatus Omnitrophota bacterium]
MSDNEKNRIRKEIIGRLREQDPELRKKRSGKIRKKLLACEAFTASKTVMIYVSMPEEVATMELIRTALTGGKKIAVPYLETGAPDIKVSELRAINDLEKGPYGIYQPEKDSVKAVPLKEIELVIVPAVAFDPSNMRLGRGKGYYDRFLSREEMVYARTIGLAFSFQIVDRLPSAPHDRPVSRVITD